MKTTRIPNEDSRAYNAPTVVQHLEAARDKILDRDHWTQSSLARDRLGVQCYYGDEAAVRWCAMGAMSSVSLFQSKNAHYQAVEALAEAIDNRDFWSKLRAIGRLFLKHQPMSDEIVMSFNDHTYRTHQEVIEVFNSAIESERELIVP